MRRGYPTRTCIGCRVAAPPTDMVRIAARPDGDVRVGRGNAGRGAYVCSVACFDAAVRRRALGNALRREMTSTEIERLRATLLGLAAAGGR